jgi:hypothetical protein
MIVLLPVDAWKLMPALAKRAMKFSSASKRECPRSGHVWSLWIAEAQMIKAIMNNDCMMHVILRERFPHLPQSRKA